MVFRKQKNLPLKAQPFPQLGARVGRKNVLPFHTIEEGLGVGAGRATLSGWRINLFFNDF